MILMSKIWDTSDLEIYECVLRTILNTVHSCFVPTPHKRDALDAKVLDRLCTATAPSIIVAELQNRRVTTIGLLLLLLLFFSFVFFFFFFFFFLWCFCFFCRCILYFSGN